MQTYIYTHIRAHLFVWYLSSPGATRAGARNSQCPRHHRHTVGTHHTFATHACWWLNHKGRDRSYYLKTNCEAFQCQQLPGSTEMVVAAGDVILLLLHTSLEILELVGPVTYLSFEDLSFTPVPCWTPEKRGSSYFLWPTLERAQVFCSQAPLPLLEFCPYPPLWTRPRGHELFSRAQQYLIFLSPSIWSRGSLSPLGPGRTLTHCQVFLQIFSLWPWSLLWKIKT